MRYRKRMKRPYGKSRRRRSSSSRRRRGSVGPLKIGFRM